MCSPWKWSRHPKPDLFHSQNCHSTPKFRRSVDIASVIVNFMVTCRVLPRFILNSRSDHLPLISTTLYFELLSFQSFVDSFAPWSSFNPFLFNSLGTLSIAMGVSTPLPAVADAHAVAGRPARNLPTFIRGLLTARCRPVGAPLRNNGKRHLSLFSSCHYWTFSSTTMGGTPIPSTDRYFVTSFSHYSLLARDGSRPLHLETARSFG